MEPAPRICLEQGSVVKRHLVVSRQTESRKSRWPAWGEWGQQGRLCPSWSHLYPVMHHLLEGIVKSTDEDVNSSDPVQMGPSRPCLQVGKAPELRDIH